MLRSRHIYRHVFSSSLQTFKDLYPKDFVLNKNELRYCQKVKPSNFRIPHFEQKVVNGNFVFEGLVHGVGQWIQNLNNSNNSIV